MKEDGNPGPDQGITKKRIICIEHAILIGLINTNHLMLGTRKTVDGT